MWYAVISQDVENSLELRAMSRDAHVARLKALVAEGRLLIAGPHPAIDAEDPGPAGFNRRRGPGPCRIYWQPGRRRFSFAGRSPGLGGR
jgi:hypothetical protein